MNKELMEELIELLMSADEKTRENILWLMRGYVLRKGIQKNKEWKMKTYSINDISEKQGISLSALINIVLMDYVKEKQTE